MIFNAGKASATPTGKSAGLLDAAQLVLGALMTDEDEDEDDKADEVVAGIDDAAATAELLLVGFVELPPPPPQPSNVITIKMSEK